MKRILTATIILVSLCFCFTTCEVGLGEQINLSGPVVNITSPSAGISADDPQRGVMFNLSGTVKSRSKIARVTVTLDWWNKTSLVTMGREYIYEEKDGTWKIRESKSGKWETYNKSNYKNGVKIPEPVELELEPPSWTVNGETVKFNLPVKMYRMGAGVYFIRVKAYDSAGLHDSNSSKNARFRYVNEAPNLETITPIFKFADGASLSNPPPPDFSSYKFDPFNDPEGTHTNILNHFTNDIEHLAWSIKTGSSFDAVEGYKMYLAITNPGDLDQVPIESDERIKYWSWPPEDKKDERVKIQNGVFSGDGTSGFVRISGINYDIIDKAVEWEGVDSFPKDKVTPLQLVSRISDNQGNEEYLSNGYLLYLPDSDLPYATVSATKRREGESKPAVADLEPIQRGALLNGVAFDDDGLTSLRWELYNYNDDSNSNLLGSNNIIFNNAPQRQTWSIRASYGPGNYKIIITVTDIKNNTSEPLYGYFTILSNSTPTIKEFESTLLSAPLWGDNNGDFLIKGTAQIEDSDIAGTNNVKVDRVTVVWLKDPNDAASQMQYTQSTYNMWDSPGIDSKGNKIWEIPSNKITFVSSTDGNKNINQQEEWDFELPLNLFTDLEIGKGAGKNPFVGQTFFVRFLSEGTGRALSSVTTLPTRNDETAPTINITGIILTTAGGVELQPFTTAELINTIATGDKVRITGNWADNSMSQWKGRGDNRHQTLMNDFSISWRGEQNKFDFVIDEFTLTSEDGGTWKTEDYEFEDFNEDPIVILSARLADISGNLREEDKNILIATDYPMFARFTSSVADGIYGKNKDTYPPDGLHYIDIIMEFNKSVSIPNPSLSPSLKLNNGATATFVTATNGTKNITFRYSLTGTDETANIERLNVESINWGSNNPYGSPKVDWHGTGNESEAVVAFPTNETSMFDEENDYSLYKQKEIEIDNTPPAITNVTTTASAGSYGVDSIIDITVEFSEEIKVTGNPTLNLGAPLSVPVAYNYTAGARNIVFSYKVLAGHNTSNSINVANLTGGSGIVDLAGNPLSAPSVTTTIPSAYNTLTDRTVDTTAPSAPIIGTVVDGKNYYKLPQTVTIEGLEADATVEYQINYVNDTSGWTQYTGTITSGKASFNLTLSGSYKIVARQSDKAATNPNTSSNSTPVSITIDDGAILEQITSPNSDGYYSYGVTGKNSIDITMRFRINVDITKPTNTQTATDCMYVELNVLGAGSDDTKKRAYLKNAVTASKTATFTYNIPEGVYVNKLDVLGIGMGNSTIREGSEDLFPDITNDFNALKNGENNLAGQKDIIILTGNPEVKSRGAIGGGSDITFGAATPPATGMRLSFKFDREIFRTGTTEKFVIMQIRNGYRIPAVMTEERWNEIFNSRGDIFSDYATAKGFSADFINLAYNTNTIIGAGIWRAVGEYLYQKGSNGASSSFESDTSTKYVLRYDVDTAAADTSTYNIPFNAGTTTVRMDHIREIFRAAEALTFTPSDPAISITNNETTLVFNLSGNRALQVEGAQYQWSFPINFVKDALDKVNKNTADTSRDSNLTSTTDKDSVLVLKHGTIALPVIRIDKGDDTNIAFVGTGNNRQATQRLATNVRVDSRTPSATVTAETRHVYDNVTRLLFRNSATGANPTLGTTQADNTNYIRRLPNLGTQAQTDVGQQSYENTRMRPQSGVDGTGNNSPITGENWVNLGLSHYSATMTSWEDKSSPFTIGDSNYMSGGMKIQIRATATPEGGTASTYAYEVAYRSVFVYNNTNVAGNANELSVTGSTGTSALTRVWVRGGDSTVGDPVIPDFPIARSGGLWKKVRLLTPITPGTFAITSTASYANTSRTNTDIPTNGAANALWFWVTWRINVPAYIDLLYAELPSSDDGLQAPAGNIKSLFQAWVPSKEHYALFPGRTTIVETRTVPANGTGTQSIYYSLWDGNHGGLSLTDAAAPQPQTDK